MAKLVDLSELAAQNSGVAKIALEAVQDLLLKLIPCSRAQVKRIWAQHAKEHASQRFSLPSSRLPAAAHAASALCSLTFFSYSADGSSRPRTIASCSSISSSQTFAAASAWCSPINTAKRR